MKQKTKYQLAGLGMIAVSYILAYTITESMTTALDMWHSMGSVAFSIGGLMTILITNVDME